MTICLVQSILYFLTPSISLAIVTNILTVAVGYLSMSSLGGHFRSSLFAFPHTWFLIAVSYLFVLIPILHISNISYTNTLFPGFDWETNLGRAVLISGLFMNIFLALSLLYFLNRISQKVYFKIPVIQINLALLILVFLYSIFGFGIWINQIGGLPALLLTRSAFTQSGLQFQNGYLYASLNFGFGAILLLLLKGLFSKDRILTVFSFIVAIIFMLPDLIRGTRVNGLFAVVCCVTAYALYRNSIGEVSLFSKIRWLIIVLSVPLVVIAPRLYRVQRNIALSSFMQAFDARNLFDSFAGYDSAMDLGLSIFLKSNLDLGYGKSYIEGILRPVPRAIWPGKPHELDVYLNQAIFPETSSHVGISFSGFSEPMFNFGLVGVILFALVLGWLSSFVFLRSKYGEIRFILLTIFLSAFSFNVLRGNLSSSYSQLVFPLVASFLIIKKEYHPSNREYR